MNETIEVDVAIIGGSFGAVAAAIALTDRGYSVAMTDEFKWIGGQVTSQGLCVLDELYDPVGETVMNARYNQFREKIREYYRTNYQLSQLGAEQLYFCPGNSACSPITAEPHVAHEVIGDMLMLALKRGRLKIFSRYIPIEAECKAERCLSITCRETTGDRRKTIRAQFFLDGTETGDTYPLLHLPYRLGAESKAETGEEHASLESNPLAVQSFTYSFVVEFVPGGNFLIPKPTDYEKWRDHQPFHLFIPGAKFFKLQFNAKGERIIPFWHYRRLLDHQNFDDPAIQYDRAVINVGSNDYHDENFVDSPRKDEVLEKARQLSRAYLYWLQTEAPRDEGGFGYPELRPMPRVTGTEDGLAQAPYVREGRRLRAYETVVEEDISTNHQVHARARQFTNSVGVSAYFIDIHALSGGRKGVGQMARPYQIPLGSLVSPKLKNFAVACKGIGVTQIANGAYRLHTPEWAIGEAAGELAAYCLENKIEHPHLTGQHLFDYQRSLLKQGIPLYWYEDLPTNHPAFEAAQLLALTGIWPGHPDHLRFEAHHSICRHRPMFLQVCERLKKAEKDITDLRDLHVIAHGSRKGDVVRQIVKRLDQIGWPASAITRDFPEPAPTDYDPLDAAYLW